MGASFGGHKPLQTPSRSAAADNKEQAIKRDKELLKEKDRELQKLREQLRSAQGSTSTADAATGAQNPADPDERRLKEIAAVLKQLGDLADPAVQTAKCALIAERDEIKSRMVRSKPFTGQIHHYTARIDALQKQRTEQLEAIETHQAKKKELEDTISQLQTAVAEVDKDIADLEAQRWQVSAKAPAVVPGNFTLKA